MANLVNIVPDHCSFDPKIIETGDVVCFLGMSPDDRWSVVGILPGVTQKVLKLRTVHADGRNGQTFVSATEVYSLWRWQ